MAGFSCQCRQTTHEGATNAQDMNMHGLILGGGKAHFIRGAAGRHNLAP
jgi:hypothetical protein